MKGFFVFIMVLFSFSTFAKEIHRYKLDGNAIDSGLGALSGNIVGNVSPTQDRNGDANKAMLFQKGMIVVDGVRNVDFGSTFSISFWMRRDWQNDYMGIIGNKSIDIRMGREGNGSFIFSKEGANKRGNSSRLTQSFHFFMFEPIFSPVNALNQPI